MHKALPCCWLFLSSSLLAISPLEIPIDRQNLPSLYALWEAPEGTIFALQDHLVLSHLDSSQSPHPLSCFTNTQGPLSFLGNSYSGHFHYLNASSQGLVIHQTSLSPVTFSSFDTLSFTHCGISKTPSSSSLIYSEGPVHFVNNCYLKFLQTCSLGSGAAIYAPNLSIQNTLGSLNFENNTTQNHGGALAILSSGEISENFSPLLFSQNSAENHGGAIYLEGPFEISNNASSVILSQNKAQSGGAIYTLGELTLSGNTYLSLQGNTASSTSSKEGCGGGIYTPSKLTLSKNHYSSFSRNLADSYGGAICAHQLTIASTGPTIFIDNHASKGSAIAIQPSGELQLSADFGDILFQGNTSSQTGIHNAIHLASQAKLSKLQARKHSTICFFDPITSEAPRQTSPLPTLTLNPQMPQEAYIGTLLFSGEKLLPKERALPENLTSTLHHKVVLAGGTLSLKKEAQLHVSSFSQAQESLLIMEIGTTLATTNLHNPQEGISIQALAIPLNSLDGSRSAHVNVTTPQGKLQLSGNLKFLNTSEENFYETHDLLNHPKVTFPLLKIPSSSERTKFHLDPQGDTSSPYGYQGTWKLFWEDSETQTSLKAIWEKTGYLPHPERQASLVPNTLWGIAMDLRAVQDHIHTLDIGASQTLMGLWGASFSNLFYTQIPGNTYHHNSWGHLSGLHLHYEGNMIGGLVAQIFSKSHDNFINSCKATTHIHAAYGKISSPWIHITASFGYAEGSQALKTAYKTFTSKGSASWGNLCRSGELSAALPWMFSETRLFSSMRPFIKLQAFEAKQNAFEEKDNPEARHFEESSIRHVSLPIGITCEKRSKHYPTLYKLEVAYSQDLYHEAVTGATMLAINQASWLTPSVALGEHAWIFLASGYKGVNRHVGISANFSGELRKNSRMFNFSCGSKLLF